jgi:dihydroorotate dehydrogenase
VNISEENILMPIEIAGIKFRNPFCVSSGPALKSVDQLLRAQRNGWAEVSIKLTCDPALYINPKPRYRWYPDINLFSFTAETRLNIEEGLKPIEQGRKKLRISCFLLILAM